MSLLWLFSSCAIIAAVGAQRSLLPPDPKECATRILHERIGNHYYFYSWRYAPSSQLEVDWLDARNICRKHCMDAVSLETIEENLHIKQRLQEDRVRYIWTSGRKCNFAGCELRPELQPADVRGWFWSGSNVVLPPSSLRVAPNDWSQTGGIGLPQPDNREVRENGNDEACLAVLNNFYNDGVNWHDVACHHLKPFVCEDSDDLIKYAKDNGITVRGIDFDIDRFN